MNPQTDKEKIRTNVTCETLSSTRCSSYILNSEIENTEKALMS